MPWMVHECGRTCRDRMHALVCGSNTFSLHPSPAGGGAEGGVYVGITHVQLWWSGDKIEVQGERFAVLPANSSSLPLQSENKRAVTGNISAVQRCSAWLEAIVHGEFPYFPYSSVERE